MQILTGDKLYTFTLISDKLTLSLWWSYKLLLVSIVNYIFQYIYFLLFSICDPSVVKSLIMPFLNKDDLSVLDYLDKVLLKTIHYISQS